MSEPDFQFTFHLSKKMKEIYFSLSLLGLPLSKIHSRRTLRRRWMQVVESGWKWMKISAVLHASLMPFLNIELKILGEIWSYECSIFPDYCLGIHTQMQIRIQVFLQGQRNVFSHGNRNTFLQGQTNVFYEFLNIAMVGLSAAGVVFPPWPGPRQASGVCHRLLSYHSNTISRGKKASRIIFTYLNTKELVNPFKLVSFRFF